MKYETSQNLSREEFKRLFGVKREIFAQMMELMKQSAKSKGKGTGELISEAIKSPRG